MNSNERGPTYADVADYAREIRSTWGDVVRFEVTPPIVAGRDVISGWVVRAETWRNDGPTTIIRHRASCSYGSGGGTKTMPAAMWRCLFLIWQKYEDEKGSAAAQAAF